MTDTPMNPHLLDRYRNKRVRVDVFQPIFWEEEEAITGKLLERDDTFIRLKPGTPESDHPECLIAIANIDALREV